MNNSEGLSKLMDVKSRFKLVLKFPLLAQKYPQHISG